MHSHAPRERELCFGQCPVLIRETLDLIAAKWTVPIFFALQSASGPVRYAELQRRLGDITPKELAKHLRNFETAGLVKRTVYPTVPPRVEYALTELGESLLPSLQTLADWAINFGGVVTQNRKENERPLPVRLIKPA
ncbi:MAG: helix-turn-helix domain-containing protein [Phyllobacterium sp.]|jgi:DNA-binding HxlR family transcriptional regulator|uniref:winged helix-turn-helix transcriptional regulator n=1 Tax=Phyllobacterium sp. TaxID=1871046 RepID=UPI0030EFE767